MKPSDLSLVRNTNLTDEEVGKLELILAFHDRLPTEAMRQALLILIEDEPFLARTEFDRRLDQFAAQAKAAMTPFQAGEYAAYIASAQVH